MSGTTKTPTERSSADALDVIVIGGGTAGVVAAVQAARAGAKTLLVEKNGILGGTMTTGGVSYPGLFHAWGEQVIAGIGWDLVRRSVEEAGGTLPDFTVPATRHSSHQITIDPGVYAALCDEAVLDSGAGLLLHTMLAALEPEPDGWAVTLCTKTGLQSRHASVVVDCTGDATAVRLASGPLVELPERQPATLSYRLGGFDPEEADADTIVRAAEYAIREGSLLPTDLGWDTGSTNVEGWLRNRGSNANHVGSADAQTSEGRTEIEVEGRRAFLRAFRFLRARAGLEHVLTESICSECGVRESVTIVGRETVSEEDFVSGRRWDDAVCYSFYPIDLHILDGRGIEGYHLEPGTRPTIPRGALLPRGCERMLVAGRCISSDRMANSALRVQATCMATGQAAGAIAALSAASGNPPGEVPFGEIRSVLEEHGAIVP